MCKKIGKIILTTALVLGLACTASAAETNSGKEAAKAKTTNMTAAYPMQEQVLPKVPPVPSSIKNTKEITEYVAAVNSYMDAAQKYIDACISYSTCHCKVLTDCFIFELRPENPWHI